MGNNPLVGPNDDRFGPRFPSLEDAWDPDLRGLLFRAGARHGVNVVDGVYAAYPGPSFETAAEIRMIFSTPVTPTRERLAGVTGVRAWTSVSRVARWSSGRVMAGGRE